MKQSNQSFGSVMLARLEAKLLYLAERCLPLFTPNQLRWALIAFWTLLFLAVCFIPDVSGFWGGLCLTIGLVHIALMNEYCLDGSRKAVSGIKTILGSMLVTAVLVEVGMWQTLLFVMLYILFFLLFLRTDAVYGSILAANPSSPSAFTDTRSLGIWGRFWRAWVGSIAFIMGLSAPVWLMLAATKPTWQTVGGAVISLLLLLGGIKMLRK